MLEDCTSLFLRHWTHWSQTQHDLISTTVRPHIDSSPARPGLWHHRWTEGKGPRLESSTLPGECDRASLIQSQLDSRKKPNSWISPQRDLVHIHVWYFPENSVLERTCLYCGVGQASAASHPNNVFFLFVFFIAAAAFAIHCRWINIWEYEASCFFSMCSYMCFLFNTENQNTNLYRTCRYLS